MDEWPGTPRATEDIEETLDKPTRRMTSYEREELEDYFDEDALYLRKNHFLIQDNVFFKIDIFNKRYKKAI